MRAPAILTVLTFALATPALAQNPETQQQPDAPNSGAVKPPSATTGSAVNSDEGRNQDAAKVPGLPGSKSGPAVKPPSSSAPTPK